MAPSRSANEQTAQPGEAIFGGALATGLQVGLVQCIMVQRWAPLVSSVIGSGVYALSTLWLWQWVFRVSRARRAEGRSLCRCSSAAW